ncbi:MAG: metallophosphoesterase [Bacteroidales bacterium]|nr:metallophosphoesterase [Bacteroidales bacterium]
MKAKTLILSAIALALCSCNRLDVKGMFWSSGSHTEERVEDWLAWDKEHGENIVAGVPERYRVYVCSDIHLEGDATRVATVVERENADPLARFSIVLGDIANESGERPFRLMDSVARLGGDTCFVILGNHDIYFDCEQYYRQYFHTSTYTVTVQTVGGAKDLFVFLDSGNATHGKRQLAWLREVLQHRSDYRHVVVGTHTCLFRTSYNYGTTPAANLPEDEYYELLRLMDESDVSLVVMGHFHHKEEHQIGGVPYVMTDNLNEEKDTPSYLVVTLGDDVDYKYEEL